MRLQDHSSEYETEPVSEQQDNLSGRNSQLSLGKEMKTKADSYSKAIALHYDLQPEQNMEGKNVTYTIVLMQRIVVDNGMHTYCTNIIINN